MKNIQSDKKIPVSNFIDSRNSRDVKGRNEMTKEDVMNHLMDKNSLHYK